MKKFRWPAALGTIRARLLIFTVAVFFVVLGAAAYRAAERRDADIAQARQRLAADVALIASTRAQAVRDTQRLLKLLVSSQDLDALGRRRDCPAGLAAVVDGDPRVGNLFLVRPDGDVVCQAQPSAQPQRVNLADRAFFQAALGRDGLVVGEALQGRLTGKLVLPFAQRFLDASGRPAGVAMASLDLEWVARDSVRGSVAAGVSLGLLDAQGQVLVHLAGQQNLETPQSQRTSAFKLPPPASGSGVMELVSADGEPHVLAFQPFAQTSTGPVLAFGAAPLKTVAARADHQFRMALLAAALLMLLSLSAVWLGSERLVVRPIRTIVATAMRLRDGDHRARTGLPHEETEMGHLASVFDEMAEALASENELLRLNRALQLLSGCDRALIHAASEERLLAEVCRLAVDTGGYRMAWVGFSEQDEAKSVRPVAQHGFADDYLDRADIRWGDCERGRGPTGTAIRTASPQVNQDFANNPRMEPWRADALQRGYRSSIALPLCHEGHAFGALTLYSLESHAFNPREVALLIQLAEDLAYGIHARRLRLAHDAALRRVAETLEATVQAVAAMVELRDPYTAGHQRRVATLAAAMAREMGLGEDEIHGIHLAGLVHDIGKVQIPKEILTQPERLSDEQFAFIQTHAAAGYEVLKDIDFPWPVAEIVRQHHERLDGSGYPRGLGADDILLGARILAVADTVEAMSLDRPYRKSPGLAQALAEIAAQRGRRFDASAVDACLRLFRERGFRFDAPTAMPETL